MRFLGRPVSPILLDHAQQTVYLIADRLNVVYLHLQPLLTRILSLVLRVYTGHRLVALPEGVLVEPILLQLRRVLAESPHLLSLLVEPLCSVVVVQRSQRRVFGLPFKAPLAILAAFLPIRALTGLVLLVRTHLLFHSFLDIFRSLNLEAEIAILPRLDLVAAAAVLLLVGAETHPW